MAISPPKSRDWPSAAAFQYVSLTTWTSPPMSQPGSEAPVSVVKPSGGTATGVSKPPFTTRFVATRRVPCRNELKSLLLPLIRKPNVSPSWTGMLATAVIGEAVGRFRAAARRPLGEQCRDGDPVDDRLEPDGDGEPRMETLEGPREVCGPGLGGGGREVPRRQRHAAADTEVLLVRELGDAARAIPGGRSGPRAGARPDPGDLGRIVDRPDRGAPPKSAVPDQEHRHHQSEAVGPPGAGVLSMPRRWTRPISGLVIRGHPLRALGDAVDIGMSPQWLDSTRTNDLQQGFNA